MYENDPTLLLAGSWERLQPRIVNFTTSLEFMGQQWFGTFSTELFSY